MFVYQRVSILESTNDHKEIINSTFLATEISSCEAWMRQLLREHRHEFQGGGAMSWETPFESS